MYILIDMEGMIVMHAHPDRATVSHLANIEVAHAATSIVPATGPWSFTDLELKLLYQNTTGEKHDGFSRPALEALVTEVMCRLPCSDVKPFEVQQQSLKISRSDSGFYRYAKGSFNAAKLQELFTPEAITTTPGTGAPTPPTAPDPHLVASTVPAATPAAPRGGNKAVIWSCADELWEKSGRIKDLKAVLELRKRIMDQLEQQGVKRSSASSELGNWQKVRLNS